MDAPKRIPKDGERVIFQDRYGWHEGIVMAVVFDKDGEVSLAKIEWHNWLGLRREYWAWAYELCYFGKGAD